MARVEFDDIAPAVREVLANASMGKGGVQRGFLTAYQILQRLPQGVRAELEANYGRSGKGGGEHFSGATRVAQVASDIPGVEQRYLDTGGLQFDIAQPSDVEASYPLCALFRLP